MNALDAETGILTIETLSMQVGPDFTRQQFLASPLHRKAQRLIFNEPHCSFLTPPHSIGGLRFILSLGFFNERLETLSLAHDTPELGTSWDDWTREKEERRKQIHDRWLETQLGTSQRRFAWGEIWSEYDDRSGGSSICIRYRHEENEDA